MLLQDIEYSSLGYTVSFCFLCFVWSSVYMLIPTFYFISAWNIENQENRWLYTWQNEKKHAGVGNQKVLNFNYILQYYSSISVQVILQNLSRKSPHVRPQTQTKG